MEKVNAVLVVIGLGVATLTLMAFTWWLVWYLSNDRKEIDREIKEGDDNLGNNMVKYSS